MRDFDFTELTTNVIRGMLTGAKNGVCALVLVFGVAIICSSLIAVSWLIDFAMSTMFGINTVTMVVVASCNTVLLISACHAVKEFICYFHLFD